MALAPSLTTVTITGHYVDFEGTNIEGQVRFTLGDVLRNPTDDQLVAPSSVVVPLSNGAFSVTIPATNDPDIIPNPFLYTVEESFPGGRTYTISVPYDTVGSLDLSDLSPTPTLTEEFVQLVDETTFASLENDIDTLDTLIDQSNDTIPATGRYWYVNSGFNTYSLLNAGFASYSAMNAGTFGLQGNDISSFTTSAEAFALQAQASAALATANATGTISPLLLIGG
jgi:hypothetical protein